MRLYLLLYALMMFLLISCQEDDTLGLVSDEANMINYSLVNYSAEVEMNSETGLIVLTFPYEIKLADHAIASFTLSEGAQASIDGTLQVSGQTQNDIKGMLNYVVTAEDQFTQREWQVKGTNNNYSIDWGLGYFEQKTLSRNRDYEWYLDQWNTGRYNYENCGPTSTIMAAQWSDKNFNETVENARGTYHANGGWWYTSDISNYLNMFSIPHHFIELSTDIQTTATIVKNELDAGNILILCVDMYYIRNSLSDFYRVDKFYRTASDEWGHFFIVKGYKQVDDYLFFETYDPYSQNKEYSDGAPMGKDRYYRDEDVYSATYNWWNYAISVSRKGTKSKSINQHIEDISKVPVKWGGAGI